jgi:hypothetical protein
MERRVSGVSEDVFGISVKVNLAAAKSRPRLSSECCTGRGGSPMFKP